MSKDSAVVDRINERQRMVDRIVNHYARSCSTEKRRAWCLAIAEKDSSTPGKSMLAIDDEEEMRKRILKIKELITKEDLDKWDSSERKAADSSQEG